MLALLAQAEPVSIEDIQQRAAMMRQQKQAGEAKDGLVEVGRGLAACGSVSWSGMCASAYIWLLIPCWLFLLICSLPWPLTLRALLLRRA